MKDYFCHLHAHNHYSLLDGIGTDQQVVLKAVANNQIALAETNHGTCGGFFSFYKECKSNGIKPILGVEAYICDDMLYRPPKKEKGTPKIEEPKKKLNHINLLAKNANGVKNLQRLITEANVRGFYYKPRIDLECLKKYRDDIIPMSACASGLIPSLLIGNGGLTKQEADDKILQYINFFKDNFGNEFYFEVMPNEMKVQTPINMGLIELGKKHNIKIVATNDCHYIDFDDQIVHDTLLMIQSKTKVKDPNRWQFEARKLYMMTGDEMKIEFKANHRYMTGKEIDGYLSETLAIADKINIDIKYENYALPKFDLPAGVTDNLAYMKSLMQKRIEDKKIAERKEYMDRLEYEMKIIQEKGLVNYLLIVQEFIQWAHTQDIYVGPGRGSAAGSLVAYMLGITDVDPIKFGLLFERFINPERLNMPDIDSDFEHSKREAVKDHLIDKYGRENVASICTYSTLQPASCFKDVCRVYDVPFLLTNSLVKTFVTKTNLGEPATIEYIVKTNPKMTKFAKDYPEIIKIVQRLEGQYRHCSVAAGGVLITDKPITEYLSLRNSKDNIITEWDKYDIEEAKLLKMDVLGIQTLTVIKDTLKMIGKDSEWLYSLQLNDRTVLDAFTRGETDSIFQYESDGMHKILTQISDMTFDDLVAVNALYRPGSMEFIESYIRRKKGLEPVSYPFHGSDKYLHSTFGICIYQEQLMQIVSEFGGLTMGEADFLRKAKERVTDENKAKIEKLKAEIIKRKGDILRTQQVIKFIDSVGGYSFNKSHSLSYALLGYFTMYLKMYYPKEFCLSVLNGTLESNKMLLDTRRYLKMAAHLGVNVKPVDINKSFGNYSIDKKGDVRRGLLSISGIGDKAVAHIIEKRPFKWFSTYTDKVDKKTCNKTVTRTLVTVGAFDDTDPYFMLKPAAEKFLGEELKPRYFYELTKLGVFVSRNPLSYFKSLYDSGLLKHIENIYKMDLKKEMGTVAVLTKVNEKEGTITIDDGTATESLNIDKDMFSEYKDELIAGRIMALVIKKMKWRAKSKEPTINVAKIIKIFVDKKSVLGYILDRGGVLPPKEQVF